jgi:hypothetical protein
MMLGTKDTPILSIKGNDKVIIHSEYQLFQAM